MAEPGEDAPPDRKGVTCDNCGGWGKVSNLNARREETLHECHVCTGSGRVG